MQNEAKQSELDSAFGDGWFEGFMKAKALARDEQPIEDYDRYTVLEMSEDAEAERPSQNRSRWDQTAPTKQGLYWHWTGSADDTPIVLSVLRSGTNKQCFVSAGQYGIKNAIFCKEYGP